MSAPTPNAELAYLTLGAIDAHPELWDQTEWCGTAKCFAGWAVELSGERAGGMGMVNGVHVGDRAAQLLGFTDIVAMDNYATELLGIEFDEDEEPSEKFELFGACNTREDLGHLVEEIFGPRPASYGTGCRCTYLGEGTPEHTPSALCRSAS